MSSNNSEVRRHYNTVVEVDGQEVEATLVVVCGDDGLALDIVVNGEILKHKGIDCSEWWTVDDLTERCM